MERECGFQSFRRSVALSTSFARWIFEIEWSSCSSRFSNRCCGTTFSRTARNEPFFDVLDVFDMQDLKEALSAAQKEVCHTLSSETG